METTTEKKTYSNPRTYFRSEDWPFGNQRCVCEFYVEEKPGKGQRVVRRTSNRHGGWNKPKTLTYGGRQLIVDGSDGKTYLLSTDAMRNVGGFDLICVMQANMQYQEEYLSKDDPRYPETVRLFESFEDNRPDELKPKKETLTERRKRYNED